MHAWQFIFPEASVLYTGNTSDDSTHPQHLKYKIAMKTTLFPGIRGVGKHQASTGKSNLHSFLTAHSFPVIFHEPSTSQNRQRVPTIRNMPNQLSSTAASDALLLHLGYACLRRTSWTNAFLDHKPHGKSLDLICTFHPNPQKNHSETRCKVLRCHL